MSKISDKRIRIMKVDEATQIIEGVVYEPNVRDTHDDWMSPSEIKKAAYNFMKQARTVGGVDTNHDQNPVEAFVCESYIAKADDPSGYVEGAWIVAIKVEDPDVWSGVVTGDYESLSMYGEGFRHEGKEPTV